MMISRITRYLLTIGTAVLIWPSKAEACGCGGTFSSLTAVKTSDLVFVGAITKAERPAPRSQRNADGSIGVGGPGPVTATFEVAHTYLGARGQQVVITGNGTDCEVPFAEGEVWLVYARVQDNRVTTNKCTRTRLRASASSDLFYLDALEQKRPVGIVYGNVHRRITRADGQPALQGLFEPLQVVVMSDGRRTEITTDPGGAYQLALPPGGYEIWVERTGVPVGLKQSVQIADRVDQRVNLTVDYKN
jgi:hypothetical protein